MTELLDFNRHPLWLNTAIFVGSAIAVFFAGVRITKYADAIARKTGLGHAAIGLFLLGGITSLPEIAVSLTAAAGNNAALAVNNILGGVAMQVTILALADVAIGKSALTSVVAKPIVLLQGTLNILLLTVVAAGITIGDFAIFGIGVWVWVIMALFVYAIDLIARSEGRLAWRVDYQERNQESSDHRSGQAAGGDGQPSLTRTVLKTSAAGAIILIAGYLLAKTGEAIAQQTGLGSSFVGAVFLAISTSLPEMSTVLTAVRLGNYVMAISDIFGTNLFDIALVFPIDALAGGTPILNQVGRFSTFAALLALLVTALFLGGLIERRDRTVLRMGYDSFAVIGAYFGGLVILYSLR